ncbi:MAG TPA: P-loop NTPase fold protein [Plasticicumulans sp.]|nr:P-loop NTPase fold protein [Plasticicumulans sp.]
MEEFSGGIRRALAEAAGLALTPVAEHTACFAAWLNALRDDDYHVSFSSLMLGVRLLGYDDWFEQQCEAALGPPPRMLATLFGGLLGERTLDTARACAASGHWPDEDWPNAAEPAPVAGVPWPRRSGRGELSASAASLLRFAGNRARTRQATALDAIDLIAAFVLDTHGHERQMESQGFELQRLRAAFAAREDEAALHGTGSGSGAPSSVAGAGAGADHPLCRLRCDDETRYVLRHAVNLALGARRHAPPILTLRQILYALLEAGSGDGPVVTARGLRASLDDFYRPGLGDEVAATGTQPDWPPPPFAAGEPLPEVWVEVTGVLDRAVRWCAGDPLELPALALALVAEASDAATRAFAPLKPLTQAGIGERWLAALHAGAVTAGRDPSRYEQWLYGEHRAAPSGVLPDLGRPRDAGDDCLDVRRYALALAATAVARDTAPPLAIGVFGDWGAGKSHFMGLMELEMRTLAAGGDARFHRHVLPVWFNAWHYADANLWASLMQALLEAVAGHFTAGTEPGEDADFTRLLRRLDAASSGAALARTELAAAERSADEARKQFETARDQAQIQECAVQARLADLFQELLAGQSGASIGKDLADELTALGFDELAKTAAAAGNRYDAILATVAQAETLTADARAFWLALRQWQWIDAGLLLAIAAGGGALIWALHAEATGQMLGAALTASGAAAAALGWLRQRFGALGRLRERLAGIRQKQAEAAARAALSEPARAAETARRDLEAARQRLDAALAARQQATAAVSESFVSARIARFVEQRLKSGLYREQLSLVSTIRRDLDTIARFLGQQSRERAQQEAQARERLAGLGLGHKATPALDRIVLYIDDLDRCPPERVVEVLEAVHLLLAMPLFVVVVGVDVRWVSAALCRRYRGLLVGERGAAAGAHPTATPTDYLEKIFQIPFRLPAIDAVPARRLLGTLTGVSLLASGLRIPGPAVRVRPDASDAASRAAVPAGPDTPAVVTERPHEPADAGAGAAGADAPQAAEAQHEAGAADEARHTMIAVALSFSADEAGFMARLLATLGGSPRRVRRFVNSYRVYKAALRDAELRALTEGGGYREVLTALALQIGLNPHLGRLREALLHRPGDDGQVQAQAPARVPEIGLDPAHRARLENALDALRADGDTPERERRRLLDLLDRPDIARFSFAPAQR